MKKDSDLNKFEKRADKATEIIASIGMATSLSSFLTLIPSTNNDLGIITGGTILLSPCVYFGMNYLKEKAKDRQLRDMHHASQLFLMMREGNNADHNVTKSSTLFLHELHQEFNGDKRNGKRHDRADRKIADFRTRKATAFHQEFQNLDRACARHDGDCKEEGKFRACGAGNADKQCT